MTKLEIKENDLIKADCNYLQQVEKVKDKKVYTHDSRFPYDLEDINEVYRKDKTSFILIWKKGGFKKC